ncbi:MAG: hypothetical protein ACTS78_01425 [Arsenophonus sp. NC-WZS1-MAG3]
MCFGFIASTLAKSRFIQIRRSYDARCAEMGMDRMPTILLDLSATSSSL